jgi:hypothetical protein
VTSAAFDHGWLAAVLPADATRFRAVDEGLAAVLADAGAELVETGEDVDIAPASELRGEADLAVVSFAARPHDSTHLAVRVGRRLASAAEVRIRALRARTMVRRRGYPRTDVVFWDVRQQFRARGARASRRKPVEYLPQRALVIGRRAPLASTGAVPGTCQAPVTLLDASVAAAGAKLLGPPSIRSGLVAAMTDKGLIRIAVGPSRRQLEGQSRALELLRATGPEAPVAERAPWLLAAGKAGLAEWSLERRLAGSRPAALTDPLRGQCLDFLVALHTAGGSDTANLPSEDAKSIAAFRPEQAAALAAVGSRLDSALADVPRGFGHGDFFLGNLLTEGNHLSGVVDWDAGGPGRLPLLDLIHLQHLAQYSLADEDWGPSLVRHLFPWAQSGADEAARTYCSRIGLDPEPDLLETLAVAYWLDRVAYTLRTHRQRRTEPRWLARNVDHVLEAVA